MTDQTPKTEKNPKGAGRKWFDGKDEGQIVSKLEETAALDASLEESLFYADISEASYYRYLKAHPDFEVYLKRLRNKPVLKARKIVMRKMGQNYQNAMDYLRRKKRKEFGDSVDVTSEGENIRNVNITVVHANRARPKSTSDGGVREEPPSKEEDSSK